MLHTQNHRDILVVVSLTPKHGPEFNFGETISPLLLRVSGRPSNIQADLVSLENERNTPYNVRYGFGERRWMWGCKKTSKGSQRAVHIDRHEWLTCPKCR
jgi:hypothetical protein